MCYNSRHGSIVNNFDIVGRGIAHNLGKGKVAETTSSSWSMCIRVGVGWGFAGFRFVTTQTWPEIWATRFSGAWNFSVRSGTRLQVTKNFLMLLEPYGEHSESLEKPAGILKAPDLKVEAMKLPRYNWLHFYLRRASVFHRPLSRLQCWRRA